VVSEARHVCNATLSRTYVELLLGQGDIIGDVAIGEGDVVGLLEAAIGRTAATPTPHECAYHQGKAAQHQQTSASAYSTGDDRYLRSVVASASIIPSSASHTHSTLTRAIVTTEHRLRRRTRRQGHRADQRGCY
jgi:hypothetical protein